MITNNNSGAGILLIEDNATDVELALRAFKKHHLSNKVIVVKDGEEALDFLFCRGAYAERPKDDLPRVIFLDLKLPKANGTEILKAVRSDARTKLIPVVVLTSSHEERNLLESYELGVNSYVVKPVEFNKFVETVGQAGLYWLIINKTPYKK